MNNKKLIFFGSKESGYFVLKHLLNILPPLTIPSIVCPDDISDDRNELEKFKSLAALYGIPLYIAKTSKDVEEIIRKYRPNTVILHGWYRLLVVSKFPNVDFLGFHYSPLPLYRGNAPLVWQIINGEKRLGVSFFTLTDGMDDGDLVDQSIFEIDLNEDISDAIRKANEQAINILNRFVPQWLAGDLIKKPQSTDLASYCGLRLPADGHIDWGQDALKVHNFIRAQTRPYPGAYSLLGESSVVRIFKSSLEPRQFFGVPGSVVEVSIDHVVIACGDGAIRVRYQDFHAQEESKLLSGIRSLRARFR